MPETIAPTREQQIRRFVELDALGTVMANLAMELDGHLDSPVDEPVFLQVGWDGMGVRDSDGFTIDDSYAELWPVETVPDYEKTVDWQLAQAESCALAARLLATLATDEGRAVILKWSIRLSAVSEAFVTRAREFADVEGGCGS